MIFNCGPHGSGSSSGIDFNFGGKFDPINHIIIPENNDNSYHIEQDNNGNWEIHFFSTINGEIEFKKNIDVDIFLMGGGYKPSGRRGGNGGKYLIKENVTINKGKTLIKVGEGQTNSENEEEIASSCFNYSSNDAQAEQVLSKEIVDNEVKTGNNGIYAFNDTNSNNLLYNKTILYGASGGSGGYRNYNNDNNTSTGHQTSGVQGGTTGGGAGGYYDNTGAQHAGANGSYGGGGGGKGYQDIWYTNDKGQFVDGGTGTGFTAAGDGGKGIIIIRNHRN